MKTYDFREFMKGEHEKKIRKPSVELIPLAIAPFVPTTVFAETTIQTKITTAFQPLIELIQAFAYPVALSVVLGGSIFIMIGNTEKGYDLIFKGAMGYVLCMLLPVVFQILVDAMAGVL